MKRGTRLTPGFLQQLRTLRVVVVHPNDADGTVLLQQLQRIGCQVQAFWPSPSEPPPNVDVMFCAVHPGAGGADVERLRHCKADAVIAVIGYENPTVFDEMLRISATGVLTSPLRPSGVLAALVMALGISQELRNLRKRVTRLEQKLESASQIAQAKAILIRTRGVSDADAYRIIREQAMTQRVATEEIARAIIRADALLNA